MYNEGADGADDDTPEPPRGEIRRELDLDKIKSIRNK